MFWGNGDTSKLTDRERETLDALRRMVETGHIVALTPEQTAKAVEAINFFSGWRSMIRFLESFRNVAILVGALLGMWWVGQDAFIDFIREALTADTTK